MQIEKSVVLSKAELLGILTKAVQIGDWPATVTEIEFFFDGVSKVRLRVVELPKEKEATRPVFTKEMNDFVEKQFKTEEA